MNISDSIPSLIKGVGFGPLTAEDIKRVSVRRIQFPTTFDDLLNPVVGGLYDPALGAFADHPCKTCRLTTHTCPGHAGHIELPVVVYNVVYMSQILTLLRAACQNCHKFRLARIEINLYCCKLRLLEYNLLVDTAELDGIQPLLDEAIEDRGKPGMDEQTADNIIQRRIDFVQKCLHNLKEESKTSSSNFGSNWAVSEARKALIKDFMSAIGANRRCKNCQWITPKFRKDGFTKIFETRLGAKEHGKNAMSHITITNPILEFHKSEKERARDIQPSDAQEQVVDEAIDLGGEEEFTESSKFWTAGEVHAALSLLFRAESEILNLIYHSGVKSNDNSKGKPAVNADMFFIRLIQVPPNRYRPEAKGSSGEVVEDPQNSQMKTILTQSDVITQIHREMAGISTETDTNRLSRRRDTYDLKAAWIKLQESVNSLLDQDRNPGRQAVTAEGIKQKLEKKEGLFRKHMMGKRVNFAARSVISPDPNIETNEIGVPPVFAMKLTYPEPVTHHNCNHLRKLIVNGPYTWPGAEAIEREDGSIVNLKLKSKDERQALADSLQTPSTSFESGARSKKVHRHLRTGDVVLMNRQPTLHKPSIMGHKARVLKGEKTIRMHYANCNTYNADFDGDEMNMHFPQNELARAEAMMIANTDNQYLSSTGGKPLRGLIQDHISMGVWLTNRDTFFDRAKYQQLIYDSLRPEYYFTATDRILLLPPAILRPTYLWTGKQVVSTVLLNLVPEKYSGLTLESKSSTAASHWGKNSEEEQVIFQDGELLCGILDKSQMGPSANGLVHSVYEVYSPTIAGRLLSVLGRLLTQFLRMRAFSCGIEDIVLTKKGDEDRNKTLIKADKLGIEVAAKYVSLEEQKPTSDNPEFLSRLEDVLRDEEKQIGLDTVMNAKSKDLSSEITKSCLPVGLIKPFPRNQMQLMTNSGAKGSQVNANLISCNLGQQVLEGRRVPTMVAGKTLPCFTPFDTNIRAGGYICDRFLTGIRTQEYYFHAMAGREGLIDTAVKTSRSGYLQRCLIKGMEGMTVGYDTTVRDADGTMIEWLYGEDGLDIPKVKGVNNFKFIAQNARSHYQNLNVDVSLDSVTIKEVKKYNHKVIGALAKNRDVDDMDPVLSQYNPGRFVATTSENFAMALRKYIKKNPDNRICKDKDADPPRSWGKKAFESLANFKYLRSVIEPGEPVGIVAAQSIGEPSTQMTLNTFHLAGHSAKNVTLGIPRLREIVMTASRKINTPLMALHVITGLPEADGHKFAKSISQLSLAEVTDTVTLEESTGTGKHGEFAKIYNIKIKFFPSSEYTEEYAIEVSDIYRTLNEHFLRVLTARIKREHMEVNKRRVLKDGVGSDAIPDIGESVRRIGQPRHVEEAAAAGEDEDEDDGDATNMKYKANQGEKTSYDAPDEEEAEIAADGRRDVSPELEDEGFGGSPPPEDKAGPDAAAETLDDMSVASHKNVTVFQFDRKKGEEARIQFEYAASAPKILMLPLIERTLRDSLVQSVPGIAGCVLDFDEYTLPGESEPTKCPAVLTTGVNLTAMFDFQHLINPNRIFTNDVGAMLTTYGVEAARNIIIREMAAVFEGHGISVDRRHLNLIGDFMTRGGDYVAFSRQGLNNSASPFTKMSFETTIAFLRDTVLEKGWDDLSGPSSRLVVGKLGTVGTGGLDVLMPLKRLEPTEATK